MGFFRIPQWMDAVKYIDLGALVVILFFIAIVLTMRTFLPKIGAIGWVTAKEAIFQPLFSILILVGLTALLIFPFIPYYTLGDDIKLVITQGLILIKLLCVFLAVWTASSSISDEIEGKTALMALSKPIGRTRFILGKYLGVMICVSLLFLILSIIFVNTVSYKVVYDARETAKEVPDAVACLKQVVDILPGLALAFFETCLLGAIAIAVSTRLSLLPNLTVSLVIYLLGHLVPVIVQSSFGQFPLVAFIANAASAILPNLEHFSMETAVAMEKTISMQYLLYSGIYSLVFCLFALALSLLLFEDRDLA